MQEMQRPDGTSMRELFAGYTNHAETKKAMRERREELEGQGLKFKRAAKIGRNDPCPCGSGKKYKKCHGAAA